MDAQLKKGVLDLMVLSILKTMDAYGYIIYQRLNASLGISESTIYPILRRMVTAGYVDTYLKPSGLGPARKYFTLTKEGHAHHEDLLESWHSFESTVNTFIKGEFE
ncbi:MAG: PadR family transcriptional regulator [Candidatus Izemoplasmataceae bacterium]